MIPGQPHGAVMGVFAAFVWDGCAHKWSNWQDCLVKTQSVFKTINGNISCGQKRKCELCGLEELKD